MSVFLFWTMQWSWPVGMALLFLRKSCFLQTGFAWNGPRATALEQVSKTWATHVFWTLSCSVWPTRLPLPTTCWPESIPKHVSVQDFCNIAHNAWHGFVLTMYIHPLYVQVMSLGFAWCVPCKITSPKFLPTLEMSLSLSVCLMS